MRRGRRVMAVLAAIALVAAAAVAAVVFVVPRLGVVPGQAPADDPAAETPTVEDPAPEEEPEELPIVTEQEANAVTMAEAPAQATTTDDGLAVNAPDAFLQSDELASVQQQIHALEQERGASVSVVLLDLQTRRGISYNADAVRYPASSIKATYCTYICEENGGSAGMGASMEQCLVNSSNDAYHALLDSFGLPRWADWLSSHGAPIAAKKARLYYYPDTTANELATIWEEIWRYGTSSEPGGSELGGYLSQTNHSPIGDELRGSCQVWSKPGWYPADGNGIQATNDTAVVFSDEGPYVMIVMTDLSSDLDALRPLVRALADAHTCMCGDAVAYYEY